MVICKPFLYKLLFITFFALVSYRGNINIAYCQLDLLEKELEKDSIPKIFGANEKHFFNFLLGFGLMAGPSGKGLPVRYARSGSYNIGLMYRYQWKKNLFCGGDFSYRRFWYLIDQTEQKSFPTTQIYEDERFVFQNLSLNAFLRYKISTPKDKPERLGLFLDFGTGLELPISVSHRLDYEENGESVQQHRTGLRYRRPIYFNSFVRVGYNKIFGRFAVRLIDIFKDVPQLPVLTIGVEVGLY